MGEQSDYTGSALKSDLNPEVPFSEEAGRERSREDSPYKILPPTPGPRHTKGDPEKSPLEYSRGAVATASPTAPQPHCGEDRS